MGAGQEIVAVGPSGSNHQRTVLFNEADVIPPGFVPLGEV